MKKILTIIFATLLFTSCTNGVNYRVSLKKGDIRKTYTEEYILTETCTGAKWMAEQGVKATASVGYYGIGGLSILTKPSIKKLGFKEGGELEIILRKK